MLMRDKDGKLREVDPLWLMEIRVRTVKEMQDEYPVRCGCQNEQAELQDG